LPINWPARAKRCDGVAALASGVVTGARALLGDERSRQAARQGAEAAWEYVGNPENWPALLGAMAPEDREKLAVAYETGDARTIGRMLGAQVANMPLGSGGLGTVRRVGNVVDAAENAARGARKGSSPVAKGISWNPLTGAGPLGEKIASTFRSSTYTEAVASEATTLYRVHGGPAGELGGYWTRTPPAGPVQSIIDSALNPIWGNTATNVTRISVPAGTRIFEGVAAPQGGLVGGGNQIFIQNVNPAWLVK